MKINQAREAGLTADALRDRVSYDPILGKMIWKKHRRSTDVGREIGYLKAGYRYASLKEGIFQVHRLIWLFAHGEWPSGEIDHINCVRDDNRLSNLRVATPRQNLVNRPANGGRKLKGITRHPDQKRWIAQIRDGGKNIKLGNFDTPEEAHAAYAARAVQLHGEFART